MGVHACLSLLVISTVILELGAQDALFGGQVRPKRRIPPPLGCSDGPPIYTCISVSSCSSSGPTYNNGDTCTYECAPGCSGPFTTTVTCNNGEWDGRVPICQSGGCKAAPPTPPPVCKRDMPLPGSLRQWANLLLHLRPWMHWCSKHHRIMRLRGIERPGSLLPQCTNADLPFSAKLPVFNRFRLQRPLHEWRDLYLQLRRHMYRRAEYHVQEVPYGTMVRSRLGRLRSSYGHNSTASGLRRCPADLPVHSQDLHGHDQPRGCLYLRVRRWMCRIPQHHDQDLHGQCLGRTRLGRLPKT
ncbi:uncharacterized protein [Branchiostoma lanceolatum]|uniref:uncharacterized protein isoform X2 n=1 Tax=Branchiostoma lanceolatum TaxID=7740 RepID=UPI003453EE09